MRAMTHFRTVRRPDRPGHPARCRSRRARGPPGRGLGELRERAARLRVDERLDLGERAAAGDEPGIVEGSWSSVIPTTSTTRDRCACRARIVRDAPVERVGRWAGWCSTGRGGQRDDARMMGSSSERGAARRRSRGRVIVNTGAGRAFQTGLDMAQLARDPRRCASSRAHEAFELRFTSWHNDVGKPVIAAVNECARARSAFRRRCRHRHRRGRRDLRDPHVSVGQASVFETIALAKKSPMEACCGWRWSDGTSGSREARVRARHLLPGRRPAGQLRAEAQKLGELIARNSPRPSRTPSARCGEVGSGGR